MIVKTDCEADGSSAALIIRVYWPPGAARLSPVPGAECGHWRHRPMESRHPALAPLLHTPTQHSLGWSLFLTIPSLYLHYIYNSTLYLLYTILLPSYVINMIHNLPFSSQTECRAVVTTTCRRYVLLTAIVVSYAQSIITSYPKLNFGTLLQWQEHTQRDLTSNSFHLSFIQNTAALSSTCPQPVFMFGLRAMGRGIFRRLLLLSENNINPSYTVMPAQITG